MSLDCEGDGASCVECGEFDFLPYACLRCGGTFCAAHTICHHIPGHAALTAAGVASAFPLSEAQGDAEVSKAAPLCMPLQGASSTLTEADATPTSSALSDRQQHRCAVCQSVLCALAPCPQCGDCYCAAHRFHGHEDVTSKKWQQLRANPRTVFLGQRDNSSSSSSATTVDPIAALCSTFTAAHPLVLAPVGYRSRRMHALALIVAPATAAAMAFTGTTMSGSEGPPYTIGVCSLIVATEMSVGQLCDRLVGFLRDAWIPVMEQEQDSKAAGSVASLGWSEWVSSAPSSLLSVVPAVPTPDSTAAVGSAWRRVPALSLVQLPADVILRKAPIVSATVLLRLADTTTAECMAPEADVALRHFMTTILYGKATSSSTAAPWTSAMASAHRDDRVKALATRLYLQQQLLCRTTEDAHESIAASADVTSDKAEGRCAQLLEGRTGASVHGIGTVVELTPDAEGDSTPSLTTVSDAAGSTKPLPVVAVWPFRHAPPLNNFNFFNSKLNPCGTAAIRPAAAPRVVVAVFVADATLPVAVMPMCIAVGHNWPLARVVDRIREEVGEQQLAQHRDARAALNTFSVHHLGNGSGASSAAAGIAREPVCLWSGYAQPFTSSTPVTLQSADVLLLCPADSPGAEVALREELQRLRGLTGKAKAALKADQVKKESALRVDGISALAMSEAVVRAERELYAYVVALQNALQVAAEDAMPQSLWDGTGEEDGVLGNTVADENHQGGIPDTLIQQVERETALERRRIQELLHRQLAPQRAALCASIVQLSGGQDASGNIIDVPVAVLDQEIAAAATESAELGRRMVELYDEAAWLAARIEAEVMGKSVPSL